MTLSKIALKPLRIPEKEDVRSYQKVGILHLMSGKNRLLLDDMGLGKTMQTIIAFSSIGFKKILIICPPAVKWSWANEIKRWSTRKQDVHVLDGMKSRLDGANIIICPCSLLQSNMVKIQLLERKWSLLVIDELHMYKATSANRTKVVLSGRKSLYRNSVYVWGLTGTLMTNTPIDIYPTMRTIGDNYIGKHKDWMSYTRRYCKRYRSKFGWDVSGAGNLDELRGKLFGTGFALRREKSQVLKELPDKQFRFIPISKVTPGTDYLIWDDHIKEADFTKPGLGFPGGELAEMRKASGILKAEMVIKYLEDLDYEKLIVFTWHQIVTQTIWSAFSKEAVTYYGANTSAEKLKALKDFIEGDKKMFVANIGSAGTGLDGLQKVCSHCVFAEIPWTYTEIMQATDRLHRMGQKDSVLADIPIIKDSTEGYIMKNVFKKKKYFEQLLTNF